MQGVAYEMIILMVTHCSNFFWFPLQDQELKSLYFRSRCVPGLSSKTV